MDILHDTHPVVEISRASIEKGDLNVLVRTIQPRRPKVVLEIGTWKGYSAEVWYESFHPETLITIERDKRPDDAYLLDGDKMHYLWETDSNSEETLQKVKSILGEKKVEFLFLDGDHNYNAVKRDWELYYPLVADNGIIAFHDICYTATDCQVPAFWDQLKRSFYYVECNVGKGSTGLGFIYNSFDDLSVAQRSQQYAR